MAKPKQKAKTSENQIPGEKAYHALAPHISKAWNSIPIEERPVLAGNLIALLTAQMVAFAEQLAEGNPDRQYDEIMAAIAVDIENSVRDGFISGTACRDESCPGCDPLIVKVTITPDNGEVEMPPEVAPKGTLFN